MSSQKGKFWEIGIWLFYIGFVLFVLGCIAFVAFRRYDLVEPDYYEKGLAYQKQLTKILPLPENRPVIAYDKSNKTLSLAFPDSTTAKIDSGSILFFRPNDADLDFRIQINLEYDSRQKIRDKRLTTGFWRLKINWFSNGKEYYCEEMLFTE